MAAKKKSGACKWFYVAIPALILVVFICLAVVDYDNGFLGAKLWDYLLDEMLYQSAGICLLIFDILFALYFLAILFVSDKLRAKLAWLTRFMLLATAVVNIVIAIYMCSHMVNDFGWKRLTFAGVLGYIAWYGVGAYALLLLVLNLVKTFKK